MRRLPVLHPMLFAALPAVFLYARNVGEVPAGQLCRPLLVCLLAAGLLWLAAARLLGRGPRAAVLCSALWLWLFGWGPLSSLAAQPGLARFAPAELVQALWLAALVAAGWLIVRSGRPLAGLSGYLNGLALLLLALQLPLIAASAFSQGEPPSTRISVPLPALPASHPRPNIHIILVDGYARADVLQELYGYDNRRLLDFLRRRGFYVAERARANYSQTQLCLASAFNLRYLDDLPRRLGPASRDKRPLRAMVNDSELCAVLRHYGYHTVSYSTGINSIHLSTADVFVDEISSLTDFERLLWGQTMAPAVLANLRHALPYDEQRLRRQWVLFGLDHVADVSRAADPQLTFMHLLCPHPPFLFRADGRPADANRYMGEAEAGQTLGARISREEYVAAYREQTEFISAELERRLGELLDRIGPDDVVVLESDHGPGSQLDFYDPRRTYFKEKMAILTAVRLPGGTDKLWPDITPVNLYRVVLNHCFGTAYPRLPDESYFSTWDQPYRFLRVTRQVVAGTPPEIRRPEPATRSRPGDPSGG